MSVSWLFNNLIAAALLPPLNGLLLAAIGAVIARHRPRLGRTLIATGFLLVAALSLGIVARALTAPLESRHPVLAVESLASLRVDAVVVIGGGRYRAPPEFASADDVSGPALDRLRYAALLARESGRPLLVSGGAPDGGDRSEAQAMAKALERDFGVVPRWLESSSDNTFENARRSAAVLMPERLRRIALVTHAHHMPRAVAAFSAAGFEVLAAPTVFLASGPLTPLDFIPRAAALHGASRALHEWIGLGWYALRSQGSGGN